MSRPLAGLHISTPAVKTSGSPALKSSGSSSSTQVRSRDPRSRSVPPSPRIADPPLARGGFWVDETTLGTLLSGVALTEACQRTFAQAIGR